MPKQGIDEADAVGPGLLAGTGDGCNVGDVGAELHDHRLVRHGLDGPGDRRRRPPGRSRSSCRRRGRWGRRCSPPGCPHWGTAESFAQFSGVLLQGEATHVGHAPACGRSWPARAAPGPITASMPGFCRPTALSMPPGVSAMRGVGLPNRGSSVVPLQEKAAENVEVIPLGKLLAVAEGAAGGDHRVVQMEPAQGHREV